MSNLARSAVTACRTRCGRFSLPELGVRIAPAGHMVPRALQEHAEMHLSGRGCHPGTILGRMSPGKLACYASAKGRTSVMRPFEGIRVIDATHVLAGPFAAYQLGVLGADVIKIEDPNDPDQSRSSGTDKALNDAQMGTSFLTQASNKRSVALDLKQERDRDILKKLVTTADVFVENYRPGAFEALGLGYDALVGDQSAADLRLVLGVRPERPARQPDRLRPRHPGHLRHHGDDRHEGRASGQVRRAGGRLRDRHDRRVRTVGRALPARAHRQRPAHRHGDARRGDDPDGLARHRLSPQRRASQAPRQPPSARDQRRVRRQGRQPGDARREQHPPAGAAVEGCSAAPRWRRRPTTSATPTTPARSRCWRRSWRRAPPTNGRSSCRPATCRPRACAPWAKRSPTRRSRAAA